MRGLGDRRLFVGTVVLWVAIVGAYWPHALSFADEVGYVGHAKLLLRGQLQPTWFDPGIWVGTADGGVVSKYPLLPSLLLAPLFWLAPRAVFALSMLAAIATAWGAYRLLASWGRPPCWALLLLAHPTVAILSRTAMMDVLLSALTIAAWLALRRGRSPWVVLACAALACSKPTGLLIAGCLLAGELARAFAPTGRYASVPPGAVAGPSGGDAPRALRAVGFGACGWLLGAALTMLLTYVATGSWRMGYQLAQPSEQAFFAAAYVPEHAALYARALLLCPPLLVLGAWPLWRRGEYGGLLVACGLIAAMSAYFFADRGASELETLVLSQRLILPAVCVLLIGYADGLAACVERWPRLRRAALPLLAAAPLAVMLAIAARHQRWQAPMARALAAAAPLADRHGRELALTGEAFKAGLLYPGRTLVFAPNVVRSDVVLCSAQTWSRRSARGALSCAYPAYRREVRVESFEVLRADPPERDARPPQ